VSLKVLFFWLIQFSFGVDCYVVHIDHEGSPRNLFMKDGIHYGLEGGQWIGESKEHYCWLEESLIGYKGCLVLVFLDDLYSVVPPVDIDSGDQFCIA